MTGSGVVAGHGAVAGDGTGGAVHFSASGGALDFPGQGDRFSGTSVAPRRTFVAGSDTFAAGLKLNARSPSMAPT